MDRFPRKELKFMVGVCSALGLRQLGLMLVLPFISLYGKTLWGHTPALIGLALGIYGLAQGCLQIPYGMLSDRIGRKPIMLVGLLQLIAGLIIAYYAKSIYIFILARALQGSGAINAAALSWVGDSVENNRIGKAMGVISSALGVAIAVALIGGGILQNYLSISQIFLLCAILTAVAWLYILMVLPEEKESCLLKEKACTKEADKSPSRETFLSRELVYLYSMGFILNFLLMGMFYIFPQVMEGIVGENSMWKIFLPAVIAGMISVRGVNIVSRRGKDGIVQPISFCGLLGSILCLLKPGGILIAIGVIVFFSAFICLNAQLTSGVNLAADEGKRGMIQGISNTVQFIGSFLGGTLTGVLWGADQRIASIALISVVGVFISIRHSIQNFKNAVN